MPVLVSMDSAGWLRIEFAACAGDSRLEIYASDRSLGGTGSVSNYYGETIDADMIVVGEINPQTLADGSLTADLPRSGFSAFSPVPSDINHLGRLYVDVLGYRASADATDLGLRPGESVLLTGRLGLEGSSLEPVAQEDGNAVIAGWCADRRK